MYGKYMYGKCVYGDNAYVVSFNTKYVFRPWAFILRVLELHAQAGRQRARARRGDRVGVRRSDLAGRPPPPL